MYYAANWNFQEINGTGKGTIVIYEDGSVNLKELNFNSTDVTDKGNETYEVKFVGKQPNYVTLILTLKFTDDTNGSYEVKITDAQETTTWVHWQNNNNKYIIKKYKRF